MVGKMSAAESIPSSGSLEENKTVCLDIISSVNLTYPL